MVHMHMSHRCGAPRTDLVMGGVSSRSAWFDPSSVAVVGASNRSGSAGASYLRALDAAGFAGDIWVVHPSGEPVLGHDAYPSISALPAPPDLAIIAVPARAAAQAVAELGALGCRAVHVFSGGFIELGGDEATGHQRRLLAAAAATNLAVLGPNCMGIHRPKTGLTFRADLPALLGTVGIVSQSGGVTINLIQLLAERGIGTSAAVSFGNGANRGAGDWAEAVAALPETGPIAVYVESGGDPHLSERLACLAAHRPVFVLRPEGDQGWDAAAQRHTGAPGGSCIPVLRSVTVVHELVELSDRLELAVRASGCRLDRAVVFLTISGGSGVLAAAALAARGLPLQTIPEALQHDLEALDASGLVAARNPVDLGPRFLSRRLLAKVVETIAKWEDLGAIVVHLPWDSVREIDSVRGGYAAKFLALLVELANTTPLIVYFPPLGLNGEADARRMLRDSGVPVITALAALTPSTI